MFVLLSKRMVTVFAVTLLVALGGVWYFFHSVPPQPTESASMAVSKPMVPESAPDFFVEYRLERDRLRSEKADVMREILQTATNDEARGKAQDEVVKLVLDKQKETEVENLLKARGFGDALALIRDQSVQIIVKAASLNKDEVLQISHVVRQVTGVKEEQLQISAKP